jgi:hypothetical protein
MGYSLRRVLRLGGGIRRTPIVGGRGANVEIRSIEKSKLLVGLGGDGLGRGSVK